MLDLRIYDVAGKLVRVLANAEVWAAGRPSLIWDGRDDGHRQVPSGLYLYRLRAGSYNETRRMTLIR